MSSLPGGPKSWKGSRVEGFGIRTRKRGGFEGRQGGGHSRWEETHLTAWGPGRGNEGGGCGRCRGAADNQGGGGNEVTLTATPWAIVVGPGLAVAVGRSTVLGTLRALPKFIPTAALRKDSRGSDPEGGMTRPRSPSWVGVEGDPQSEAHATEAPPLRASCTEQL